MAHVSASLSYLLPLDTLSSSRRRCNRSAELRESGPRRQDQAGGAQLGNDDKMAYVAHVQFQIELSNRVGAAVEQGLRPVSVGGSLLSRLQTWMTLSTLLSPHK